MDASADMEYIIQAYSPSKGITLRELQLESAPAKDKRTASLFAESFARRLNERKSNGATDWQPKLDLVNPDSYARTQ